MPKEIRVLLLEDSLNDAELIEHELQKTGAALVTHRVDTEDAFLQAIQTYEPDLILSDFSMPSFDGLAALEIAMHKLPDVPFIFISGTIGEEKAIEALKKGATDYVLKDRPARLANSVLRALRETEERLERKRAEDEWKSSQELFRLITENVVDLIAVLDLQGRRLYNSKSYQEILGNPDDLRGTDSFREVHADDRERIKAIFFDTVRTGTGHRAHFRFIGIDKKVRFIESNGSVIRDQDGKVSKVVVVSRDVTEQKTAELLKENLEEQLRHAQKMEGIGTLAGGVAHDFNNILSIIVGFNALLEKEQLTPKKKASAHDSINRAVERGTTLVRQLMTFARKSSVHFEPTDINVIIQELMGMLSATFPKMISFHTELAPDLPMTRADGGQLHQALLNLCVNARDAMPQGGKLLMRTSTVSGEALKKEFPNAEEAYYIAIQVEDTGTGMDEATRRRIFEPFFTTKEYGKGTGLGLAVVYGAVKAHHGFIEVESIPGKGTSFHLYLPVKDQTTADNRVMELEGEAMHGTETILVVEDEEMLADFVETLLGAHGYHVLVAHNGREAVEIYREHTSEIDLVLSDLGLPELEGDDAFLRMREANPQVKVVFATGYIEEGRKADLLQMGAHSIVQKPYVPNGILKVVRSAIDTPFGG